MLGGGGSPAPMLELVLQILLAAIAAHWLITGAGEFSAVPRPGWWIGGLIVALHLAQLIPLPPALWQGLPGRESELAALGLIGEEHSWRPISLSPARTLASLLAAFSALLVLLGTAMLDLRSRWKLVWLVAGYGLATLVLGAAQLAAGPASGLRVFDPNSPFLTGFQANHNSTADSLLIAMLAVAASARHLTERADQRLTRTQILAAACAASLLLALGVVLTGSRAGILLLMPVAAIELLILRRSGPVRWRTVGIATGSSIAAAGLAAILLWNNRAIAGVAARFTMEGEFRPELWRDAIFALGQFWPIGSGQGTFAPVMMAVERLEVVDPSLPHRAHNDYIELAVTSGLPGLIVLGAVAVLLLKASFAALRAAAHDTRGQVLFAAGTLGFLGLHSLVDYPLRSMALAALAALAAGLLFVPGPASRRHSGEVGS